MADDRDRAYAELIVDGCLGVQPGWQVLVGGNPQAKPLLEELCAVLARRGAYALLRVSFEGFLISAPTWVSEAPLDLIGTPAPLFVNEVETADALIFVSAPDNTRNAVAIDAERIGRLQGAYRPGIGGMMNHPVPWLACQDPTPALAQDAGMSTAAFAELLYGAVLLDWAAQEDRMRRIASRFDEASEIRIVG